MGDVRDPGTLVLLNAPEIKAQVMDGAAKSMATVPKDVREKSLRQLQAQQDEFSRQVTQAFADSLRHIFIVAGIMMLLALMLLLALKERALRADGGRKA